MKIKNHTVHVDFCDKSNVDFNYDLTSYGSLVARDQFVEMCQKGDKNGTVFETKPHVVKVKLTLANLETEELLDTSIQEYICTCVHPAQRSA